MSDIGNALKRKFGPLPAWAWLAIIAGGLYLYRRSQQSGGGILSSVIGSGTTTGTGTTGVTSTSGTGSTMPPQVLQPGESIYDPNTGSITTAPGGGTNTTGNSNNTTPDTTTPATTPPTPSPYVPQPINVNYYVQPPVSTYTPPPAPTPLPPPPPKVIVAPAPGPAAKQTQKLAKNVPSGAPPGAFM